MPAPTLLPQPSHYVMKLRVGVARVVKDWGEGAMVADGGRESESSTQTTAPAGRNELAQRGSAG